MTAKNLAIFDNKAQDLPTFAKENSAGLGMENVSQSDMSTPQIKLLQAMSPELQDNTDLKQGQLYNTVNRLAYDEMYCVNLYFQTKFSIFNKKQRQLVEQVDSKSAADTMVEGLPGSNDDYEVQETKINYCVALDVDEKGNVTVDFPFIMYMKKTQVRVSNEWNTMINNRYGSQSARWAGIWKLGSKKRSNDNGTWFVPAVEFAGYVQDKGLFDELTKTYEAVSGHSAKAAA